MEIAELKRKLRQLKKFEAQVRFKSIETAQHGQYVWNEYFSAKDECDGSVKYNMKSLLGMNHEKLKEVFDEYFFQVYLQHYKENGITPKGMYDTSLLSSLGLPPYSTIETIKSRFRELAKKYHPDHGGDCEKFIELLDTYRKLTGDE